MDKPHLATRRTALRPLDPGDVSATHALWIDPGVRKYLWDDVVITHERAAEVIATSDQHFADHGYGLWAVRDAARGELLGICGCRPVEDGEPELLFALWPQYWGQGFANEASRAVMDYLFDVLDRPVMVAAVDVPNEASIRALERLGMARQRRGTLNGLDTFFYRLTQEAHRSARSRTSADVSDHADREAAAE